MKYPGFIGGSYTSQSVIADAELTMNWYVEEIQAEAGKVKRALYPTPGFRSFVGAAQGISDIGTRALFERNGRCFAVIGGGLWEIFATQTVTKRGTVANDGNPAQIVDNGVAGSQLLIASGGNAYAYALGTNTLTQVLTGEATMVGVLDGYGLAFNSTNGKVRESALNDVTTWPAAAFFQRSIAPDPWQAMVVDRNRQIWLIGQETGEVWYDTGASPQPFAPVGGAVFGRGTASPWSVTLAGDYITWLERTKDGAGRMVAARGYNPDVISNYAVDTAVSGYARTASISDAETLAYTAEGHTFVNVSFPSARATHTVDAERPSWHQRGQWDIANTRYDIWGPRAHAYAFGQHLVGDRKTGTIAVMDVAVASEADGRVIRRLRRAPGLTHEYQNFAYHRLELLLERGVGLATGQGSDPKVMLRMSADGGKTWGSERHAGMGAMGRSRTRTYWTRLGAAEDAVFEIAVTDPVPARVLGAWINNTPEELAAAA